MTARVMLPIVLEGVGGEGADRAGVGGGILVLRLIDVLAFRQFGQIGRVQILAFVVGGLVACPLGSTQTIANGYAHWRTPVVKKLVLMRGDGRRRIAGAPVIGLVC